MMENILEVTWSTGSPRERTVKDTAAGELTPDPFPQLANGTGPNRTRAKWKFNYALVNHMRVQTQEIPIFFSVYIL